MITFYCDTKFIFTVTVGSCVGKTNTPTVKAASTTRRYRTATSPMRNTRQPTTTSRQDSRKYTSNTHRYYTSQRTYASSARTSNIYTTGKVIGTGYKSTIGSGYTTTSISPIYRHSDRSSSGTKYVYGSTTIFPYFTGSRNFQTRTSYGMNTSPGNVYKGSTVSGGRTTTKYHTVTNRNYIGTSTRYGSTIYQGTTRYIYWWRFGPNMR